MANIYDLAMAISNVMSQKGYDGSGAEIGLKREEGDPILDSRVMDGFSARVHGNQLIINYHSLMSPKDFHNKKDPAAALKQGIKEMFDNIEKFLKAEVKKLKVGSLRLKQAGEDDALIQYLNRHRYNCVAKRVYNILGTDAETVAGDDQRKHKEDVVKSFVREHSIFNVGNKISKLRNV
tara:strand:- start:601 stop:1137 length:537 start_codon:yes stop_codon:yes gene_type:complete